MAAFTGRHLSRLSARCLNDHIQGALTGESIIRLFDFPTVPTCERDDSCRQARGPYKSRCTRMARHPRDYQSYRPVRIEHPAHGAGFRIPSSDSNRPTKTGYHAPRVSRLVKAMRTSRRAMSRGQDRTLTSAVDSLMPLQSGGHQRPTQIRDACCRANSRIVSVVSVVSDQFRTLNGRCDVPGSNPPPRTLYGRQPLSVAAECRDTRDKRDSGPQPARPARSTQ